jgi:hypothetical protein
VIRVFTVARKHTPYEARGQARGTRTIIFLLYFQKTVLLPGSSFDACTRGLPFLTIQTLLHRPASWPSIWLAMQGTCSMRLGASSTNFTAQSRWHGRSPECGCVPVSRDRSTRPSLQWSHIASKPLQHLPRDTGVVHLFLARLYLLLCSRHDPQSATSTLCTTHQATHDLGPGHH